MLSFRYPKHLSGFFVFNSAFIGNNPEIYNKWNNYFQAIHFVKCCWRKFHTKKIQITNLLVEPSKPVYQCIAAVWHTARWCVSATLYNLHAYTALRLAHRCVWYPSQVYISDKIFSHSILPLSLADFRVVMVSIRLLSPILYHFVRPWLNDKKRYIWSDEFNWMKSDRKTESNTEEKELGTDLTSKQCYWSYFKPGTISFTYFLWPPMLMWSKWIGFDG